MCATAGRWCEAPALPFESLLACSPREIRGRSLLLAYPTLTRAQVLACIDNGSEQKIASEDGGGLLTSSLVAVSYVFLEYARRSRHAGRHNSDSIPAFIFAQTLRRAADAKPILDRAGVMTGFLFDEKLAGRFRLDTELPISTRRASEERMTDRQLGQHARKKKPSSSVTKNATFRKRIILAEPPPRVVHLRIGNMRRREFELWIQRCWPRIEAAAKSHKLVNVFMDRIQSVRGIPRRAFLFCSPGAGRCVRVLDMSFPMRGVQIYRRATPWPLHASANGRNAGIGVERGRLQSVFAKLSELSCAGQRGLPRCSR